MDNTILVFRLPHYYITEYITKSENAKQNKHKTYVYA